VATYRRTRKALGAEVREKGFTALKTNIFLDEGGKPRGWRPGFGVPPPRAQCRQARGAQPAHPFAAIREGAGPDVELLLGLNFNAKTEGI
jgi:L-alanine-DL-glutamate epimerase-like enolase superfamily enzyme